MVSLGEIYSIYRILKEIWTHYSDKKGIKETNFGLLSQEYFNEKKAFNSFFYEFRGEFLQRYKFFKSPNNFYNAINRKSVETIERLQEKSDNKKSIAILATIKALKNKISKDKIKKIEKDLENLKPLLITLEESIKNLPNDQDLQVLKNFIITINFSEDNNLDRKFKRTFFLFIEAYEKTPIHTPYLQLYLNGQISSNFSNTIHNMMEKAIENPHEYSKKMKIVLEGLNSFTNLTVQEKELAKVEKYIIKYEKNKSNAKKLNRSLYSFTDVHT